MGVRVPWVPSGNRDEWPSWRQRAQAANARRAAAAHARREADPTFLTRYAAEYYARRVASGICVKCRADKAVTGRRQCARCLELARATTKRRADARRKSGTCPACGAPTASHAYCERCTRLDRARIARRGAAGRCVKCGVRDPAPQRKLCALCLAGSAELWRARRRRAAMRERIERGACERTRKRSGADWQRCQRRIEAGLCPRCEAPAADSRQWCAGCRADKREARAAKVATWAAAGRCLKCGSPRDRGGKHCGHCLRQTQRYKLRYLRLGFCRCGAVQSAGAGVVCGVLAGDARGPSAAASSAKGGGALPVRDLSGGWLR